MAVVRNATFATDTVVAISSNPVRLHAIHVKSVTDRATADVFVSVWDTTSGAVTLGTTAPKITVVVPKNTTAGKKGIDKVVFPGGGLRLPTAGSFAVTTTYNGSTGATTTAPSSVEVFYDEGN